MTEEVKADVNALWRKLLYLHDRDAHLVLGYRSWAAYCAAEFGIKRSQAHRLLDAGQVAAALAESPMGDSLNERQARELAPLLREQGEAALQEVVRELYGRYGDRLTAEKLREAVAERMGIDARTRGLMSSASNEWYTPPEIIEAAREVLGEIDLDPASSEEANKTVRAARFYTKEDDGLSKAWEGRVWMNPPFGGMSEAFVDKLIEEHDAGNVPAAIVLLNGYRWEAKWFRSLWEFPICFLDNRFKFRNPDRPDGGSGQPPIAFVTIYMGREFNKFVRVFSNLGQIMKDPSEYAWPRRFTRRPGT